MPLVDPWGLLWAIWGLIVDPWGLLGVFIPYGVRGLACLGLVSNVGGAICDRYIFPIDSDGVFMPVFKLPLEGQK